MAAPKVHRTIIHFEVFSREPLNLSVEGRDLYDPLNDLIYDVTEGDKIGDWSIASVEELEGDELVEALVRIGNDGNFFDYPFDDDPGQDDGLETHPGINA